MHARIVLVLVLVVVVVAAAVLVSGWADDKARPGSSGRSPVVAPADR
jgi:hypothetical protein